MLTFIDSVENHLTVWECDNCSCQFEVLFTDTKGERDPSFCPNCGVKSK